MRFHRPRTLREFIVWTLSTVVVGSLIRIFWVLVDLNVETWAKHNRLDRLWEASWQLVDPFSAGLGWWLVVGSFAAGGLAGFLADGILRRREGSAALSRCQSPPEPDEYVSLSDAGNWLYDNLPERQRGVLRHGVSLSTFADVNEHARAWVRTAADAQGVGTFGRWGEGLPMERLGPGDADDCPCESAFGSDRMKPIDVSVRRADLLAILEYWKDLKL